MRVREIFQKVHHLANFRSVVAEHAHHDVSGKYSFIPTTKPLGVLADLGWHPHAIAEQRVRNGDKAGFQMHTIRLRNEQQNRGLQVGGTIPEILLTNSHLGNASFKLSLGLFELVCSNGLMVERANLADYRVRHIGYTDDHVAECVKAITPHVSDVLGAVDKFRGIKLAPEDRIAYANEAKAIRWDPKKQAVNVDQLLCAWRNTQSDSSLWSTYNVVQENMLRGQRVNVSSIGEHGEWKATSRARAITGLAENLRINGALWKLTEDYASRN